MCRSYVGETHLNPTWKNPCTNYTLAFVEMEVITLPSMVCVPAFITKKKNFFIMVNACTRKYCISESCKLRVLLAVELLNKLTEGIPSNQTSNSLHVKQNKTKQVKTKTEFCNIPKAFSLSLFLPRLRQKAIKSKAK